MPSTRHCSTESRFVPEMRGAESSSPARRASLRRRVKPPVDGRSPDHRPGCGADAGGGEARVEPRDSPHHRRTTPGVRGARLGDLDGGGVARRVRASEARGRDAEVELATLLQTDGDPDVDEFWEAVSTNLAAKRLRLLFVADFIPDPLARLGAFRQAPCGLSFPRARERRKWSSSTRR